ncbi:MAG: carboxypeptidase-like regulatory domain-containing protein [Eubacteriales bacterium]|nr:carboxypeptidase-like regulatory domain-containing protein [Eubacteriales bacterium]
MNLSHAFFVKPAAHEVVETTVALSADQRPALVGTVLGPDSRPVEAALVTIYHADAPTSPIGALYTDELGRFTFGPLESGRLYHVKVFKRSDMIRTLEQGG